MRKLALLGMALVACAFWALGCGGDGGCVLEGGVYRIRATERPGGTCGPFPGSEQAITEGSLPFVGAMDSCSGPVDRSEDQCSLVFSRTCNEPDVVVTFDGETVYAGPERAEAVVVVSFDDGVEPCQSTYDFVWTPL